MPTFCLSPRPCQATRARAGGPCSRTLAALLALAACSLAQAQAPEAATAARLSTEAELAGNTRPAAIERLWQQGRAIDFTGQRGLRIAARQFLQAERGSEQGALVIVSGRTESMLKYKEVVHDLHANGWSVYIHDHRGQGLSAREAEVRDAPDKGHVNDFADYVADLDTLIRTQVLPAGHARRVLLAHSMGGAISTRWLQSGLPAVSQVQAVVLNSPMFDLADMVPGWSADMLSCRLARAAVALGAGTSRHLGGKGHQPPPPAPNIYTSSPLRGQRMAEVAVQAPETRLGAPTWGWIAQSCAAARAAREQADKLVTPLLLVVAGDDRIVRNAGAEAFCQRLREARPGAGCGGPGGGPVVVAGAAHETLIERDALRNPTLARMLDFAARAAAAR